MIFTGTVFLWFLIYSFIGWSYESTLCSVKAGRLINRGFLNGPVCPVYGVGALAVLLFLNGEKNIFALFFSGMTITCTVEYITAYILEKSFGAKWWDYSKHRFNLHGRICLLGAVTFGSFSVLLVKYIHPFVSGLTAGIQKSVVLPLSLTLFGLMLTDLLYTVNHILHLNGRLKEIQHAINSFMSVQLNRAEDVGMALLDGFESSKFFTEQI
ncbi:MAG: putative ABC transporter permease, partial [Bacillota bacterium]|nr:putative ABC transporter permease [Bacillota bacterium]